MTLWATAGSKLYIGGALAQKSPDFVASDFTSQTWTEITGLTNLGTVGDTSEAISQAFVSEARVKTLKGARNAGTMDVVCAADPSDAGQLALVAAEKTPDDYAFKLVWNDAPSGGTPSTRLWIGKVMSASEAYDEANNVIKLNAGIAVNSNVVRVAAAAGGG